MHSGLQGLLASAPKAWHGSEAKPCKIHPPITWRHRGGDQGGCRPPATHCEPVTLHHFIKFLINLFIFLFRLRGQRKHFIPFRALALPVLLVQRLLRVGDTGVSGRERGRGRGEVEQKRNKTEKNI